LFGRSRSVALDRWNNPTAPGPRSPKHGSKKYQKKMEKGGAIFSAKLRQFSTTLSPQLHHVLPHKLPRFKSAIREKPLQNTTSTTRKKSATQKHKTP